MRYTYPLTHSLTPFTLARLPTSSSLQITDRSFHYASHVSGINSRLLSVNHRLHRLTTLVIRRQDAADLARDTTTAGQAATVTELSLLSARVQLSTTVSDLGVLVDGQLSMADHVASLCRSLFFSAAPLRL